MATGHGSVLLFYIGLGFRVRGSDAEFDFTNILLPCGSSAAAALVCSLVRVPGEGNCDID